MVSASKIDLGKILRALQTIEEFIRARQRVAVLDGDVVESSIINAHPSCSILFLDEQDRRTEGRLRWLNEARLGQLG